MKGSPACMHVPGRLFLRSSTGGGVISTHRALPNGCSAAYTGVAPPGRKDDCVKRILALLLCVVSVLALCACSKANTAQPAGARFDKPLQQQTENQLQPQSNIYLTADTFYYATEDTDERNTFGTPQKLMAYDLLTGKTRTVLDGVSDIAQMCRIGNTLYFTCYTYTDTDKTQWGFCLYAYDINKDWPACIYATPNTSDGVALAPCGYTLFYLCNTRNQDGMSADESGKGELHACTAAEDKVLQSGLETDRAYFYDWSDSAAYLLTNNGGTDSCHHLDYKGKMTPTNHRPKTEPREENAEPSTKPVIVADYQNYSIEITCTVPKEPGDSDCGYRYIARYVLKEKATGKSYALCSGSYWYYYI